MIFPNYYQYIVVGKNKTVIPFTNSATPSIPDYSIYAAKYGQDVQVDLYFINENGNKAKHSNEPEFVLDSSDLIESINFGTFPDPITGYILLQ